MVLITFLVTPLSHEMAPQAQTHIPGDFGSTQVERLVEVTNSTSVTRNVLGSNVDRLRVTLTIPALQKVEDDGDIVGHSVQIKIEQYEMAVDLTT